MRRLKIIILLLFVGSVAEALASTPPLTQRGIELYRDGRWIDSQLTLLKAKNNITHSNYQELEEIEFYIAMCAVELRDAEAEEYLSQFERNHPTSSHLNSIRFAKALLYCSRENYNEAKDIFATVNYSALSSEEREKYNMRMGYITFLDKEYDATREFLAKIDEQSPIYHHALYYTSYIDYIQGDNIKARRGFSALLESDAYAQVAPFYLLQIEFNDGKYSQVLSDGEVLYPKATTLRQLELARSMAEAAFRLEDYTKAIKHINDYKDLGGEMGREESYILGFSLYRSVRYSEAMEHLRKACSADDALTQNASYHLADCYLREGNKSSASISFAMAANENFNAEIAEDALFNYAKLQYELGSDHFNETINTLTRYLNKYPTAGRRYDETKELLIAAYYNSRNYDAAYKSIGELQNPDSDIKLALQRIALYRGLESYNRGDYSSAITQIDESLAVNISPKYNSIARFYLGEIEFTAADYIAALDHYNAYIVSAPKSDENYALALYNIAYTKLMLDSNSESLGYFQRFIDSSSSDTYHRADAYNRLGDLYYERRHFAEASENYKKAMWSNYDPRYYAQYQTAIIAGITGDYSAKIDRLKSIISSNEGEYIEPAMYELGRSYIAASDYKSGVESHERFVGEYPSSGQYAQALSDLGLAYLNLGDKITALKYYDSAINAAPQSAVAKDALQGVREIYINNGDANGYFVYAASIGHSGDLNNMTKDSLSFASAQRLYLDSGGNSQASINALSEYVKDYPQGYYTVDALYFLSDSYVKCGKNRDAIANLIKLSKRGANQYTERVYDKLSTLSYNEGEYVQAAESYLSLFMTTSKDDVKDRALAGYANATIAAANDNATLIMADFILGQKGIEDKLLVKVKHAKAKILFEKGDKQQAIKIFKELSVDPQSTEGAESLYRVIEAEFNAGETNNAEQMIFDFAKSDTPQSYYLARAFILLGDIYVLRGDNFQARATYQSIIDGYAGQQDNIIEQTRAKIDKLQ